MFSCPLHNWSSYEFPCPACYRTVTSSTDVPESTPCPECHAKDEEIVRLKGLIEKEFRRRRGGHEIKNWEIDTAWKAFKRDNNL